MNVRPDLLWHPDEARKNSAQWTAFTNHLFNQGLVQSPDISSSELYNWTIENPEEFWASLWSFVGIVSDSRPDGSLYDSVLTNGDRMCPPSDDEGPIWFKGAKLNYAEQLLRRRGPDTALSCWLESGFNRSLSYDELRGEVGQCIKALRAAGVSEGDRVAGWLPNCAEAVIAMLATSAIGAIWSSCSPDFGTAGVLDRFGQIEPKVLILANRYRYAGKQIDVLGRAKEVISSLSSLSQTWVVEYPGTVFESSELEGALSWTTVLSEYAGAEPEFRRFDFNHPLFILFSSGTTGLPKCIVHGGGGTILQLLKELVLHTDIGPSDSVFYFTTCGWMMWNWLTSALATGAKLVLYDGAPLPSTDPGLLWRMAEAENVSVFGTSAKYLSALEKSGVRPSAEYNLPHLKTILSTGSPLAAESYDYVYTHVKPDIQLSSISGGTDIVSCFALGNPIGPVYRGELQMRGLGMAVDVFDENGHSLRGQAGELVCKAPFPSMPVAFWNDSDGSRYREAYFETFPGVWRHGDWVEITDNDGLIIYGRSDSTLNPGGVRIGTAEIYRQVESIPEFFESVVTEFHDRGLQGTDAEIVLFVRLIEGEKLSSDLELRIRKHIRENVSPHHVPRRIFQVSDIPRTRSGKISEIAVRDVINGKTVKNTEALANPDCLAEYGRLFQ